MVDITAISGMVSSIKSLKDISEAMIGLRDAEMMRGKVFELQSKMLEAQSFAFAAHDERAELIQRIGQLETELASLKAWDAEKERYELKDVGGGSLAYVLKEDSGSAELSHKICPACYQHRRKSILQPLTINMVKFLFCPECKIQINVGFHTLPAIS